MSQKVFGLDIGFSSLKVISLIPKGEWAKIQGYNAIPLPENVFMGNEIVKKEEVAGIIKTAIAEAKPKSINIKNVVAGLPESLTFNKIIEVPNIPKNEIESAVRLQATQFIPLPLKDVYLDWEILPYKKTDEMIKVFVVACPAKLADSYLETIKMAGLNLIALEIEPVAIARALKKELEPGTMILDMGAKTTGITIFDKDAITLSASVLSGSQDITNEIAKKMSVTLKEAEKIKKFSSKNKNTKEMEKIIEEVVDTISSEVKKSIKFYTGESGHKINKLLLCGEGAYLPSARHYLTEQTGIKSQISNPALIFTNHSQNIAPAQSLAYTTAIGLALKEVL